MAKRHIDLDDLLEQGQKVYVRNNALKSNLLLIVQMRDRNGKNRALKIPPSQFPICVSSQFSKDMIRESSDLRDALAKGVITLVDPDKAEMELKDPDAADELKSYAISLYADSAPNNAVRDSMQRLKEKSSPVVDAAEVLGRNSLPNDEVTPRIQGLVSSLVNKEKNSKDVLVQLKRMKSALTASDLTYIIRECATEAQVREFAEASLADLSGGTHDQE